MFVFLIASCLTSPDCHNLPNYFPYNAYWSQYSAYAPYSSYSPYAEYGGYGCYGGYNSYDPNFSFGCYGGTGCAGSIPPSCYGSMPPGCYGVMPVAPAELPKPGDGPKPDKDGPKPDKDAPKPNKTGQPSLGDSAMVVVQMPASARLYLNDQPISSDGKAVRTIMTPALQNGANYSYVLRVEHVIGGKTMSQTKTVRFQAGQQVLVDFSQPAFQTEVAATGRK